MDTIKFNYRPDTAVKAVNVMVEQNEKDPQATPEQKKIFEDIKTLVQLGMACLNKEPKAGPAEPGNN